MSEYIRVSSAGGVLRIELARPEAINALSLEMIQAIDAALDLAEANPEIQAVLLSGEGERGFCAGGDVRQLYVDITAGDLSAPRRYFHTEYALNARIAEFGVPIIALMHGACMGGGVGLAGHSQIRVVDESSLVAMPETKIGFTPDVGGSWLLGRAPGRLGERLGLHGQVMHAAEAIEAGFADVFVPRERWAELDAAIVAAAESGADIAEAVRGFASQPPAADFGLSRAEIDEIYALGSAADIIAALHLVAPEQAAELRALSPTALEVTLRSVRSARSLSLREALDQEQRLAEWFFTERGDSLEGIRALLVDKDKSPNWPPLATTFPI